MVYWAVYGTYGKFHIYSIVASCRPYLIEVFEMFLGLDDIFHSTVFTLSQSGLCGHLINCISHISN